MQGSFSEDCLKSFQDLIQFSEGAPEAYDFARCVRPNGTYYGSRGLCVAPNKPAQPAAPKPVSKGLTRAERSAFKAGGGNAAGMKGKSIDETIAQGKKNLGSMSQGPGKIAYKAGGGNAARIKGKSITEIVAQGRKNLARMDQGAGRTASSLTQPAAKAVPQSPKAEPSRAGKPLSEAERSAYKAGGGNAAGMKGKSIDEVIAQGKKNLARADSGVGRSPIPRGETGGLTRAERSAYKAGGGNAKAMGGMSIDEVIAQGRKNLKRATYG
jgi:ribosomal protein L12E/L44/L45/RPP1/RPP2